MSDVLKVLLGELYMQACSYALNTYTRMHYAMVLHNNYIIVVQLPCIVSA